MKNTLAYLAKSIIDDQNALCYRRQNTNFRLKIPQQSDVQTSQSELLNSLLQKSKHFESEKLSDTGSQAFRPQLPIRGPDTLLPVEGVGRGQSGEQQPTGSNDLGVIVVGWKDGNPGKAFRIFVWGDVWKATSGDESRATSGDGLKPTSGDGLKTTSGDNLKSGDSSKATSGDGLKLTSGDNLKATSGSGLTGTSGDDGITQNTKMPSFLNDTKATSGVDQQSTSGLEHSNVSSQLQKINEKMESEMKPILTQFFNIFGFKSSAAPKFENDQNMTQHNSPNFSHSGLDKLKDWFWESASNMNIHLGPML
jgi:hypothetical protein